MRTRPAAETRQAAGRNSGPLRLGVVDYLNMQPIVAGLAEAFGGRLELLHAPPSVLAQALEEGRIDAGMAPVAALFAHPEWRVARPAEGVGSMIGARGPVASVLVLGGGAPEGWRRLRPDSHSRTSNALARVILERKLGLKLEIGEPIPMDGWQPPTRPAPGEAFVLIGSRALRWRRWRAEGGTSTVLDLGEQWREWTGLPFVFAVWAARPGVDLGDWPERLEAHKRANRPRLAQIAAAWSGLAEERLTPAEALDYLTKHVDLDLDEAALAGMERFRGEWKNLDPPKRAKE